MIIDDSDNLYIAESLADRIIKMTPGGASSIYSTTSAGSNVLFLARNIATGDIFSSGYNGPITKHPPIA
jgi:hypothetical protein